MLAKLIKHEFKATARIFLPILGTVLVLTGAAALTVKLGGILVLPGGTGWGGPVLGLASGLLCLLTFIAMMAMMTAAVVVTIQRFYKNLLGDEGYLMFTLPVTPAQHITAKLAVGTVWTLLSLALAVLAGCSALMGGTVQKDTEQAKALMKEVDPSLTYNTDLEDAASRLADWLVEDSTQLTTQSGLLTRKVPMTTGSGAMLDKNVYDFIDHSTSFLFLPRGVVIGLAMNNEWGFTGYLYAPPLSEAGSALRSYAAGRTQMGAVFIEYGGETYVVAMFA